MRPKVLSIESKWFLVPILVVSLALGCTHARIGGDSTRGDSYTTIGVAQITHCKATEDKKVQVKIKGTDERINIEQKDGSTVVVVKDNRDVTLTCDEAIHAESNGFTGWGFADAAIAGVVAWFTFGAVRL